MASTRLVRGADGVIDNAAALTENVTTGDVTGRQVVFANHTKTAVNVRGLTTGGTGVTITAVHTGGKDNLELEMDNFTIQSGGFVIVNYNHAGTTVGNISIPAGGVTVRHNTSTVLSEDAVQYVTLSVAS